MSTSEFGDVALSGVADEGLARWLAGVRRGHGPANRVLGVHRVRAAARARDAARPPGPQLPFVRNLVIGDLPARLYRSSPGPRPLVIYLHGGGFVIGSLTSHDGVCRLLARTADVAVLALDYRLAPEHRGPAAVDDATLAFASATANLAMLGGDPDRGVSLAGDSAGGALAVLAAVRLRDAGTPAASLLLAYPNGDMTLSEPSVESEGHGWGLETDDLRWFVEQWIPGPARRADPAVSPVHADLSGLPPAMIATAEHDPLRDEGRVLAGRISEGGADARYWPHPGQVHGFLGLGELSPAAAQATEELFRAYGALVHQRS
ncbi:MAG TPA: alpha/beta hydrolase [Streptosporangiaceae bacterium]|jgi:acetyl esterase|nr:alpha/beta hydrolase [Streptosporangiaceae bacterium]